mgnify:CR=1 FL=1
MKHSGKRTRIVIIMTVLAVIIVLSSVAVLSAQQEDSQSQSAPTPKNIDIQDDSFGQFTAGSTTIVQGGWGATKGEFGLLEPRGEGEKEGPMSYFVNEMENIYILDQVNLRVQKFDRQGNFISATPIDNRTADRIIVDSNGNIYVFDLWGKREVFIYSNSGELIQKSTLSIGESVTGGISEVFIHDDAIYTEDAETGKLYKIGSSGTIFPLQDQRRVELPGRFLKSTQNYLHFIPSGDSAKIDIVDREGKANLSIAFSSKRKIHNFVELSSDSNGNIYLGAYLVKQSGLNFVESQFSFVKISNTGELLGRAEMPTNLYSPTRHPFYITNNGDIYQLQTLKDGLRIIKWRI